MGHYAAPLRDMQFVLHELLNVEAEVKQMPKHADLDADTINQVLEEAGKFCSEVLFPLNQVGDREGCTYVGDGVVKTPTGFKEAYQQYIDAGWPALGCDPDYGGQGLPAFVNNALYEMLNSANQAWTMYPGLSHGAYECLHAHGAPELQKLYLPKLVSGEWTGTMCLTEPHCGTDLGILRTKAEPNGDGTYSISGTKIFISSGEHDLSKNIVHLVLARLPDAPKGTKGISLFIVPKFVPDASGEPGERNGVKCGSIEHKMGIHGNATCVMNLDNAKGWLIGEPNKGLNAMFVMMKRRAPRRRHAGARPHRSRLPELAHVREGAPADALADGAEGAGQAGRPDHRPPGRAPHAAHAEGVRGRRARVHVLVRAADRQGAVARRRGGAQGSGGSRRAAHADHQGVPDRQRVRVHEPRDADLRRPRLHLRVGHGAVRARRADQHDL